MYRYLLENFRNNIIFQTNYLSTVLGAVTFFSERILLLLINIL